MDKTNKTNFYNTKVFGKDGIKTISVEAKNKDDATMKAKKNGEMVVSVNRKFNFSLKNKLSSSERYTFLNVLSTMIKSNMGQTKALSIIESTFKGNIKYVAAQINKKIDISGMNMGEAMESLGPACFPNDVMALIKAGISGGDSGDALIQAADFELELNEIKRSSSKGLYSAIFGFIFAGLFLISSSFILSPKVKESPLFQDVEMNTSLVDILANAMGIVMLVIMVIFLFLFLLGTVIKQIMPNISDKIIMRIPFYKELIISKNTYATTYGLSVLIGTGVRISDALKIVGDSSKKGALKKELNDAHLSMLNGDSKWPNKIKTFHATDIASLIASQSADQTSKTLFNISNQYRRLYAQRLSVLVPTMQLTSAMVLTVTGVIMFAQIILPMLELTDGLTGF